MNESNRSARYVPPNFIPVSFSGLIFTRYRRPPNPFLIFSKTHNIKNRSTNSKSSLPANDLYDLQRQTLGQDVSTDTGPVKMQHMQHVRSYGERLYEQLATVSQRDQRGGSR